MRQLTSGSNELKTSGFAFSSRGLRQDLAINLECEPSRQHQATDHAAFGVEPQGQGLSNAAPTPKGHRRQLETISVWPYRGHSPGCRKRLTQTWSHRLVVWSAAALGRNPGDVTVRILYVTGFAVDTVLGVDEEARSGGLFHPLVDGGRAIPAGRPGKDIVLRILLKAHVRDLKMHRLVLFVVGVGKEHR